MGKKARAAGGKKKPNRRKIDKEDLPAPPPPIDEDVGSLKPVNECTLPGSSFGLVGMDGYDDGGVGDLGLLVDLEDKGLRRKRGEADYQVALKADLLPRSKTGGLAPFARRDQKVHVAQTLFSEDDENEGKYGEVWQDRVTPEDPDNIVKYRLGRLNQAKEALNLSMVLREPSCACLCLSEISKRTLAYEGKAGAENALRIADKAIEIAGDGFWDSDDIMVECKASPVQDEKKFEKNATSPGLAHPTTLKFVPLRVSELCMRSAKLQRGNALAALGKEDEAREMYLDVEKALEGELRSARMDWERHSVYVSIGNTYSRQGNFEKADEYYIRAEELGKDHLKGNGGSPHDGRVMVNSAKRWRVFALKKDGQEQEAKTLLSEVIQTQIELDKETAELRKKEEEDMKAAEKEGVNPITSS